MEADVEWASRVLRWELSLVEVVGLGATLAI